MAAINSTRSKEVTSKRKLMRQKRCRRKSSLMKKAYEYSNIGTCEILDVVSFAVPGLAP
jgi:hypothetical protein